LLGHGESQAAPRTGVVFRGGRGRPGRWLMERLSLPSTRSVPSSRLRRGSSGIPVAKPGSNDLVYLFSSLTRFSLLWSRPAVSAMTKFGG
jgi:hypothetical protein